LESNAGNKKKGLSAASLSQIQILSALSQSGVAQSGVAQSGLAQSGLASLPQAGAQASEPRRLQINEIAELSGLRDEKETQRFLFILEGQKLVSPFPVGDFTSKVWQITTQGIQTLKHISNSTRA
jgi:hypothetical protein